MVAKSVFDKLKSADNFLNLKDDILSLKNSEENLQKGHFDSRENNKGQDLNYVKNSGLYKGQEYKEKESNEKSFKMEERKRIILNFFKEKDKLTLKDISVLLPQYGEKTIQRELLSMVAIGVLDREGKKRWTQYFLKKNDQKLPS
jgi:predicted HTH transcriptional regulator